MRELALEGADSCFVVADRTAAADGVVQLTLRREDGATLPEWKPGAHIDVVLSPEGVRQYSLHGDPADRGEWIISVLREEDGRGGSRRIHDEFATGSAVSVSALRNNFALVPAKKYIFIAGGIGITPLLPMMGAAEAAGAEWALYYGGRTRSSMAHLDVVQRHEGKVFLWPQDENGLLELDTILAGTGQSMVYCCGPEPLLKAVEAASEAWPSGSVRMERFVAAAPDETEVLTPFEVDLVTSDRRFTVPADKSILEVLEASGMKLSKSCAEGVCGSCETEVLGGTPLHRDSVLSEEERESNETMMICVSRSLTPVLELDL